MSSDMDSDGSVRLLQLADIGIGRFIDKTKKYITQSKLEELKGTTVQEGDILISRMAEPIGRACLVPKLDYDAIVAVDVSILRVDPNYAYNKYLIHVFNSPFFMQVADSLGRGTTRKRITRKNLQKISIPLPPLSEQKAIAAQLDRADKVRQALAQSLADYDRLLAASFLDMFGDPVLNPKGWEVVKLKEVCHQITDGTHHSPENVSEGIPYVTAKHIKKNYLDFESKPTYVGKEDHEEIYKRCSPEYGDVLYIKDGATTGIACINTFRTPISLLSSVALLKPIEEKVESSYICYWFNHEGVKEQLLHMYMSGAAIKRYTLKKIKLFKIPLPPLPLQQQFAQLVERIERQKALIQSAQQSAEDLFGALLQAYFYEGK